MIRVKIVAIGVAGLLLGGGAADAGRPVLAPLSISFWNTRAGVAAFIDWHSCGPNIRCRGAIETTVDGGRTWNIRWRGAVPRSVVAVPDSREAWAAIEPLHSCGSRLPSDCRTSLLHSVDGGLDWTRTGAYVTAPDFVDTRHGFGVRGSVVVGTTNGGRTWQRLGSSCGRFDYALVSFGSVSQGRLLCLGGPAMGEEPKTLYATADGGHHWTPLAKTTFTNHPRGALPLFGYPGGLDFVDPKNGWIWESRGDLYATRDGGRTWRSPGITSLDVDESESTSLLSARTGFVVLRNANAARYELRLTRNGAHTFVLVRTWPFA
jgi:photosystem II stability/assembly factor-like uncharacterized protein